MKATKNLWSRSISRAFSAKKRSASQYDPNLTRDEVRDIEMNCALGNHGECLGESAHLRGYVFDARKTIGVSRGTFTDLVYVTWHCSGAVHGYPITSSELDVKRRSYENPN
jgi:hypothetical protein